MVEVHLHNADTQAREDTSSFNDPTSFLALALLQMVNQRHWCRGKEVILDARTNCSEANPVEAGAENKLLRRSRALVAMSMRVTDDGGVEDDLEEVDEISCAPAAVETEEDVDEASADVDNGAELAKLLPCSWCCCAR